MCLTRIIRKQKPTNKVVKVLKCVFVGTRFINGKYREVFNFTNFGDTIFGDTILRGKWLKAKEHSVYAQGYGVKYTTGFHCFKDKAGTLHFGDKPVIAYIRKVHTIGTQSGGIVYVAKEMYVPKDNEVCKVVNGKLYRELK